MHIHAAALRGDHESLNFALERGVSIDARDHLQCTPLHSALDGIAINKEDVESRLDFVTLLLDRGADLEAEDQFGRRPLQAAAGIPDTSYLQLLVGRGADVKYVSASGYNPFITAAYQKPSEGKLRVFDTLKKLGVNVNQETQYRESALSVCFRFGDTEGLKRLLELGTNPAPLHWSPLHRAVYFRLFDEVKDLAREPQAINETNDVFGLSPWHLAVQGGDIPILELLASRGADIAQPSRQGDPPLHLAAARNAVESIKWLVEHGADVNAQNNFGDTPLHAAAEKNAADAIHGLLALAADPQIENSVQKQPINCSRDLQSLSVLVAKGAADLNRVDGCGEWPLATAAEARDSRLVTWILQQGGKVDLTRTGATALHTAVLSDALDVADLLLAAGANVNAQDVDGWTPLFSVQSREMILKLRSAGASISKTDQVGSTPAEWVEDPLLKELLD